MSQAIYKFVRKGAGSLHIKDYCSVRKTRYQVKEFSPLLCIGRCKNWNIEVISFICISAIGPASCIFP